jgi:tRNA threonylcarbamoyladenosine biosynthesis protein TsaB
MRTLAIETSGAACSVALIDGDDIIAERHEIVGRGHAERLIPWIASLPGGGRADRIIVGCGPGSFTGVRIGVAAARGLGIGWGVPVTGVSSLMLIAAECDDPAFMVAVEGGHGELFVQRFTNRPLRAVSVVQSLTPEKAAAGCGEMIVGSGALRVAAHCPKSKGEDRAARAANIRFLSGDMLALSPRPIYGRGADATPMQ